jgi:hypothetical protein
MWVKLDRMGLSAPCPGLLPLATELRTSMVVRLVPGLKAFRSSKRAPIDLTICSAAISTAIVDDGIHEDLRRR